LPEKIVWPIFFPFTEYKFIRKIWKDNLRKINSKGGQQEGGRGNERRKRGKEERR
jgi:hypothetical protein